MPDNPRGSSPAQEPEDLDALARRYVDLWQDQMTALAGDPDFAESLQKLMAALGVGAGGMPALMSAWPTAMAGLMAAAQPTAKAPQGDGGQESHGKSGPMSAAGAAAVAASSDGGGADLGRLEERLAAVEQRLAAMEGTLDGRAGGKGRGVKTGSKRR
jgi:hypothetical protein